MKIVIAGGTGFIGTKITDLLIRDGHEVVILTRNEKATEEGVSYVVWLQEGAAPEKNLENVDVFINLAGISINDGRWTEKHKKNIYNSRMIATEELLRIIDVMPVKPSIFINASAIGIYPVSLDTVYTEGSTIAPNDFLGTTVSDWEKKAKLVEQYGVRTAYMRFGVVLGKEGGALPLMTLPYRLYAGGTIGSGKQWVSWIHISDVVRSIKFVLENDRVTGPINVTAPTPVCMKDFGQTIGSVLNRPHWFPVPSFVLKIVLGQKSKLVLEGQKVLPNVLIENGFDFSFPSLDGALKDLYKKSYY